MFSWEMKFKRNMKNRKRRKKLCSILCICLCLGMTGCSDKKVTEDTTKKEAKPTKEVKSSTEEPEFFEENGIEFQKVDEILYTSTKLNVRKECSTDSEVVKVLPERAKIHRIGIGDIWSKISLDEGDYYVATEYLSEKEPIVQGKLIAIDAGHQEKANEEKEAIGPGASETKAKVTTGTKGVSTGMAEYELNLQVALKLKEELKSRGYEVFMVRESNDVNLSNHERAKMAEEAGAEILVRLHANGSEVSATNGVMTICGTKDSPYVADLYEDSYRLANEVLNHFVESTGAKSKGIWETDIMSGINWATIPVTIVEMGFMSNKEEDEKMATDSYQQKMAEGIADGIDAYYEKSADTQE